MSPNRRILLNIAATYGRSVYALVLGLLTARWGLVRQGWEENAVDTQKWYNMQYINMSGNLPMGIAAKEPQVRYSAAYLTVVERIFRFVNVNH